MRVQFRPMGSEGSNTESVVVASGVNVFVDGVDLERGLSVFNRVLLVIVQTRVAICEVGSQQESRK